MPNAQSPLHEEAAIENDADVEVRLFNEIFPTGSDEPWHVEEITAKKVHELQGSRDEVEYVGREIITLGKVASWLHMIAKQDSPLLNEFQIINLEDASANLRSDVLDILNFDLADPQRRGDLLYSVIGLMQAAYDIGKIAKPSDEVASKIAFEAAEAALATLLAKHNNEARIKQRRPRGLGIQALIIKALQNLYREDPVTQGNLSRGTVSRAVAAHLAVPVGAVTFPTLDRARTAVWPTRNEACEVDDV